MKFLIVLALLFIGTAVATLENGDLTNIDPVVFNTAQFAKTGLSGADSGNTASIDAFLKDGDEKNAKIEGMKIALVGSLAKDLYMDYREKQEVPDYATQVENYLDERLNRSADLTVIDMLNVTEGEPDVV